MSAYSTLRITEDTARSMVLTKILTYSSAELEDVVNIILRGRLYTCHIVPNGTDNDEEELGQEEL